MTTRSGYIAIASKTQAKIDRVKSYEAEKGPKKRKILGFYDLKLFGIS